MVGKNFIIRTTNIPNFTGVDAGSVAFANGTATISDARMVEWFREHDGYSVEEADGTASSVESNPVSRMKLEELKAYAAEKGIDLGDASKRDEIIEKIKAAETVKG